MHWRSRSIRRGEEEGKATHRVEEVALHRLGRRRPHRVADDARLVLLLDLLGADGHVEAAREREELARAQQPRLLPHDLEDGVGRLGRLEAELLEEVGRDALLVGLEVDRRAGVRVDVGVAPVVVLEQLALDDRRLRG